MNNKALIVTEVWSKLLSSPKVMDYLGEFEEGKAALAYENTEDNDTLPVEKCFIIYNIESSVAKPAEKITQEKTYLKFYIGGADSIYLVDEVVKAFNGILLASCIMSYIGSNLNPKTQTNQIPAYIARFELI